MARRQAIVTFSISQVLSRGYSLD